MVPSIQHAVNNSKIWFVESTGCTTTSLSDPSWTGSVTFSSGIKLNCAKPVSSFHWKYRGNEASLTNIWIHSVLAAIFFDGASKGNPGVSGVGGVVFFPSSLNYLSFSWGLGLMTNNQAEYYNLLMAIQLAKGKRFKSILILVILRC